MTVPKYLVPKPREAVADPGLIRPDWTEVKHFGLDLVRIDKNENIDPKLLAVVGDVVAALAPDAINRYPDVGSAYRKLAETVALQPEQLLFAAGSDGAIRAVYEAFVDPGDVVVHTDPTFAMYYVYSRMYGAKEVTVGYRASGRGPELAVERLIDAIRQARPRLVCLPNPDSPAGTAFSPGEMREIVETAGEMGAVMLVDEAYHPFHEPTCLPLVDEYGHLVVTRTFSKAWGMAGFRIGYAAASRDMALRLHKVRPMYEVNTFGLTVVERMLDRGEEMYASVRRLDEGKRYFLDAMIALGFDVVPTHGNFFHVAFGDDAEAVHAALEGKVLYRRAFNHQSLAGYSRFSSLPKPLFEPVVELIRQAVGRNGL